MNMEDNEYGKIEKIDKYYYVYSNLPKGPPHPIYRNIEQVFDFILTLNKCKCDLCQNEIKKLKEKYNITT